MVSSYTALRNRIRLNYGNAVTQIKQSRDGLDCYFNCDIVFSHEDVEHYDMRWIDEEAHIARCCLPNYRISERALGTSRRSIITRLSMDKGCSILSIKKFEHTTPEAIAADYNGQIISNPAAPLSRLPADYEAILLKIDKAYHTPSQFLVNHVYAVTAEGNYIIFVANSSAGQKQSVAKKLRKMLILLYRATIKGSEQAKAEWDDAFSFEFCAFEEMLSGEADLEEMV